ncbi:cytochrome b [Tateyamaria omphalii]|uniref:cytochrome b n=1 Tax=Tateyamaria omphalii TaxID=299262 RepID=UPI001C9A01D2|nr:cytochrome b [Tateyamaria omphalii]MBY5933952.1 cytochrome b [Tateyamaria omphalii]
MSETNNYGAMSRLNHWVLALAMIGMLGFGLYLEYSGLPREEKRPLVGIHRSLGVLVLILGLWRVGWRLFRGFPGAVGNMPAWQERAARTAHWVLLAGILLMPASGVAFTVFRGNALSVFGWFEIPAQAEIPWIVSSASFVHTYLGHALAFIVVLHIAAALKHHFVDRDLTLRRMTSGK